MRESSSTIRSTAFEDSVRACVSGRGSVIGSGASAATTGCCDAGVAQVTRPVPERRAPRHASTAAPVRPTEPATTRRCPYVPLWAPIGRRGRAVRTSAASSRAVGMPSSSHARGMPRSAISTRPACATPSGWTSPSFGSPKVTVARARTTGPAGASPSEGSPEGKSRETTGRPTALMASIAAATAPVAEPRTPVPSRASTTRRASPSSARSGRTRRRRRRRPGHALTGAGGRQG